MKKMLMIYGFSTLLTSSVAFASMDAKDLSLATQYSQSIHVVNLLANTNLADPGMTTTPVIVKYFNGNAYPCWTSVLGFKEDTTVHAGGPKLGCGDKINQVVVMPVLVADKLKTYLGSSSVNIDLAKYSTHLTIVQNNIPTFDTQSGLVANSGSITVQVQAE